MKNILRVSMLLGLVTVLWLATSAAAPVSAQEPTPSVDDQVLRISKDLYCPVCAGIPLDVCGTQACVQWRALIREKLLAGENQEQIKQYFVAQYGDRVLGAPPPEGFNLSAYLFPAFALLVGVFILFWTTRSWLRHSPNENAPTAMTHVAPEYAERIARELKARE